MNWWPVSVYPSVRPSVTCLDLTRDRKGLPFPFPFPFPSGGGRVSLTHQRWSVVRLPSLPPMGRACQCCDIFFRSDQELNCGLWNCHAPRALVGVLDHRATRAGQALWPFVNLLYLPETVVIPGWQWLFSGYSVIGNSYVYSSNLVTFLSSQFVVVMWYTESLKWQMKTDWICSRKRQYCWAPLITLYLFLLYYSWVHLELARRSQWLILHWKYFGNQTRGSLYVHTPTGSS